MSKTYRIAPQAGWAFLVPGDLHFPYADEGAVASMQEWWENRKQAGFWTKTGVLPQGDTIDPIGLSPYPKPAAKYWDAGKLMHAVDAALPFLKWAAGHDLGATMILGNHEKWALDAVSKALPELDGCPGIEFGALTGLDAIDGLEILPYESRVLLGDKCVVLHGKECPNDPQATLRKFPDQFTVRGHDHKVYKIHRTVYGPDGEPAIRGVCSVGMLAARAAYSDYARYGDFQLGFAVIEFFSGGAGKLLFRVDEHVIVKVGRRYVVV